MSWISVKDKLPKNGKNVLVTYKADTNVLLVLVAAYFGRYELPADSNAFGSDLDYNDESDEYFAPAGWYEHSYHSNEDYCYIFFPGEDVTHWTNLPAPKETDQDKIQVFYRNKRQKNLTLISIVTRELTESMSSAECLLERHGPKADKPYYRMKERW